MRRDAAISLPVMRSIDALFAGVTDGRSHFAEMAERMGS